MVSRIISVGRNRLPLIVTPSPPIVCEVRPNRSNHALVDYVRVAREGRLVHTAPPVSRDSFFALH